MPPETIAIVGWLVVIVLGVLFYWKGIDRLNRWLLSTRLIRWIGRKVFTSQEWEVISRRR